MSKGCGYAGLATIIEGYDTTIGERELHLSLRLLTRNLARDGTVYLVGEPILTCHCLQLKHVVEILVYLVHTVSGVLVMMLHRHVFHYGLW